MITKKDQERNVFYLIDQTTAICHGLEFDSIFTSVRYSTVCCVTQGLM